MINFDVYKRRDLQNTRAMVVDSIDSNMTVEQLLKAIDKELLEVRNAHTEETRYGNNEVSDMVCPECGKVMGTMMTEGLTIRACKSCRYSEVVK